MRYISLFSGIEAASVAFGPLGWEPICFAEVDAFASAVLAHRYPAVPNAGDVTAYDWGQHRGECDLIVGGPPCQAFSVAGKRLSLADDRGNLSLAYVRAIDAIDPLWSVTENVPGWLSTADNAFGCFLAAMVGADAPLVPAKGQRWTDAGVVAGPRRTAAWRILDAQYFGVPQRRRRVFVVTVRGSGNWRCAEAIFPIGQSLRGDSAPRREAGEDVARCIATGTNSQRYDDESENFIAKSIPARSQLAHREDADTLIAGTLAANSGRMQVEQTYIAFSAKDHGGDAGDINKSHANAGVMPAVAFNITPSNSNRDYNARESERAQALTAGGNRPSARGGDLIAHALRADGFDASEDGTGRGTPLIPIQNATRGKDQNGLGIGGEAMFTLDQASQHAVAIAGDHNGRLDDRALACAEDLPSGSMRQMRRGEGGGPPQERRLEGSPSREPGASVPKLPHQGTPAAQALHDLRNAAEGPGALQQTSAATEAVGQSDAGQGQPAYAGYAVRRLTPRETERLQGLPDDYTLIPYRGNPAADGPRYRAIGNSFAVPVVRWIGHRIQLFEDMTARSSAKEQAA